MQRALDFDISTGQGGNRMKRIIAILLTAALLTALAPAAFAAAQVETVLPEGNYFSFNDGSGWGSSGHWTAGKTENEGLWAQSDSADGSSVAAAYVGGKITGQWMLNAQLTPLSTENGGRAVSRIQLLDQYKNPKLIFTYEYLTASKQTALSWQTISSADGGGWNELMKLDWAELTDTALNIRFVKTGDTEITLTVSGDQGFVKTVTATVPADVMNVLCYIGLAAERTTTRFSNIRLSTAPTDVDYSAAAETAYQNLMKNFLDTSEDRLRPVVFGMVNGSVTNTGATIGVYSAGALWESTIALMAMDTYAQYHGEDSEAYRQTARRIANTVNYFIASYSEEELLTPGTPPVNHAMDDCGWNVMAFLLGYRYNLCLGRTGDAAVCLRYALNLFNNTYDHYYDSELGGGLWYNNERKGKALYAATLALAGDELYRITKNETVKARYLDIYNGVENNLRRADGLYSMSITADGLEGRDNPYDISEGGSCTYIGGNMCMAVLNARLGNLEKAKITAEGIALFETTRTGALLNDRDAWNNTFFLGCFTRELIETGIADVRYDSILRITAANILDNAVFDEGYYSAAWEGPKEPYTNGYPSTADNYWPMEERNRWGIQNNQNGLYIGSSPNQLMTTATTIHVLFAAAALTEHPASAELQELCVDGNSLWPVFNPEITTYQLLREPSDTVTLSWKAADGMKVTLNGELLTGNSKTADATGNNAVITVTTADGSNSRTYTLIFREACAHAVTKTEAVRPTCTEAGLTTVICVACGAELSRETVPATGHQNVRELRTEAGCVTAGSVSEVCEDCGAVLSIREIPAAGHHYVNGICTVCGEKQQGCDGGADCPSRKFVDLSTAQWYHKGVDYCLTLGLMNGVASDRFDPDGDVTRAMLVTILYRIEHEPSVSGKENPFADVPAGTWYTNAVIWAADRGVVNGVSASSFAPEEAITREQIATILYRYTNGEPQKMNMLGTFSDVGSVSSYAREAMNWAVGTGLINGIDGRLAPTEGATRAQIATILMRFLTK